MPQPYDLFLKASLLLLLGLREDVFTSEIVTPKSPAAVNNGFVAFKFAVHVIYEYICFYLITLQLQLKDYQHLCNDF